MQKPAPTSINLLRSSQTHYTDKILKWALTTFRFLIILTETIALAAFVYRFSLDRQIVDLGDEIQKKADIVSLYTEEPRFRNIQERLNFSSNLMTESVDTVRILQQFTSIAQGKVVYTSLSVSPSTVVFTFTTPSTTSLSNFLQELKNIPAIRSVSVNRVDSSAEIGTITVEATAYLITDENEEEETDGTE